ncbi:hypothetical protein [Halomicrococcus gelatinilyticus]|uniref:hypothetical protein n=1 Tax=Halomicrococcus gelatinilyticus TaxID=1702103 RepID=UPI002E158533
MGILEEHYDLGDIFGSLVLYSSTTALTGISGSMLYGMDLTKVAFAAGPFEFSMSTLGIWLAVSVAFATNGNLQLSQLMARPEWERYAVIGTLAAPVLVKSFADHLASATVFDGLRRGAVGFLPSRTESRRS